MNDLAALWYLDMHRLRNTIAGIARKPGRAILWLFFLLWLGFSLWRRLAFAHRVMLVPDLNEPFATIAAGLAIVVCGFLLESAARTGRTGVFNDPVDAYFLARSSLNEHVVVFWLQLRHLIVDVGRGAFFLLLTVIFYAHSSIGGALLGLLGVLTFMEFARLPAAIVGRRTPAIRYLFRAVCAFGVLVIAGAAAAIAWPELARIQSATLALGLGRYVLALWHGNFPALTAIYGGAFVLFVLGVAGARDIYPEFYASARFIESFRARLRGGAAASLPASAKPTRSGTTSLRGPWVEIWKQLAFTRRRNGSQIISIGVALSAAIGIGTGFAARRDPHLAIAFVSAVLPMVVIVLGVRSVSLANDLSKPLWWMGDGSAFLKLAAWTLGSSLPIVALLAIAATLAAAIAAPMDIPLFIFASATVPLATRAFGVFTYVMLPSAIDQRGPANALRVLLIYVALIPPVAAGLGLGVLAHSAQAGFIAGLIVFLAEGAIALVIAASRISGRGVEFAFAEST